MGRPPKEPRSLSFTATRIIELRHGKGWSQKVMAEHLGVNISTLARIEVGDYRVSLELVEKVMEVFKLNANDLIQPKRKLTKRQEEVNMLMDQFRSLTLEERQVQSLRTVYAAFANKQQVKSFIMQPLLADGDDSKGDKS